MLTYHLDAQSGVPLYEQLYRAVRADIMSGALAGGTRLPSKRQLAANLRISQITVETAYGQLAAEGYIVSAPRRGYFVQEQIAPPPSVHTETVHRTVGKYPRNERYDYDFKTNIVDNGCFPFSTWAHLSRRVLSEYSARLLEATDPRGVLQLRQEIAHYLHDFRGIAVSPENIVVGAGLEYLIGLLIQLLGHGHVYAVENPGYRKLAQIVTQNSAALRPIPLDKSGLRADVLAESDASVVYLTPSHHFPLGTVMPVARRLELLRWAAGKPGRYIIEDDYDSEFRWGGKPLPTMFGMDASGRVIYMNTFSMTIAPSVRISYVCLPQELYERWKERLGFCSCPVPAFEQYTLARFIESGHFERHISRMRKYYRRIRELTLALAVRTCGEDSISEENAGLHFLMDIPADSGLPGIFNECGVRVTPLDEYYDEGSAPPDSAAGRFVVNYSAADEKKLSEQ